MTSLRVVAGTPRRRGHDDSSHEECQERLPVVGALDDDAQREMERAAGADQRARELEVGFRVHEHPRVLVGEPEEPELLEPPARDALILEGQLVRWWVFRRRHTS
jgi:hypothetical protein